MNEQELIRKSGKKRGEHSRLKGQHLQRPSCKRNHQDLLEAGGQKARGEQYEMRRER